MTNPDTLTDDAIIDYLRRHPDFFRYHPAILYELSLPHDTGDAVSLVERQVALLRERNINMRRRMGDLLDTARENDHLFHKIRVLTLALLDARTWHELNEVLATALLLEFSADFVTLHVAGRTLHLDHVVGHAGRMPTLAFCSNDQPACVNLRSEEIGVVFPSQSDGDAGSALLLPVVNDGNTACLAIGSRDPNRFHKSMDTLFVRYVGDILGRAITRLS